MQLLLPQEKRRSSVSQLYENLKRERDTFVEQKTFYYCRWLQVVTLLFPQPPPSLSPFLNGTLNIFLVRANVLLQIICVKTEKAR